MSEPIPVTVPQINPNDEHAVVVRWHVAKGARVRAGQTLVTLETTKTTFDVDAPSDGYAFFEHEPNAELATAVVEAAAERGLLLLKSGIYSNCIRVLCPLVLTDAELDEALDVWEDALQHAT